MAARPTTKKRDPDYYLKGRERRIRREPWEWPEHERHPAVGITRRSYDEGWLAQVGTAGGPTHQHKVFSDSKYGGPQESLKAAMEWRQEQVEKRGKKFRSRGWKLGPEQAGGVTIDGNAKAVARLAHDGAVCRQSFAFKKYGGKERAVMLAELAVEVWREEAKRISLMPRKEQERIARRGGWTARKGFPATREQMELPLDG